MSIRATITGFWLPLVLLLFSTPELVVGQQMHLELLQKERIVAPPGKVLTIPLKITNLTNSFLSLQSKVLVPSNWQFISNEESFSLDSKKSIVRLVSLVIPNDEKAERYFINYQLFNIGLPDEVLTLKIGIEVETVNRLSVKPVEAPKYIIGGEAFEAKFVVNNFSNATRTVALKTRHCELLGPSEIELRPNSSQIVKVKGLTLAQIEKISRLGVFLEARMLGKKEVKSHAFHHLKVIPNLTSPNRQLRNLPTYFRANYIGRQQGENRYLDGFQGEFYTNGYLDIDKTKHLEARLRGPSQFNLSTLGLYDEYFVAYNTNRFGVEIGDRIFSMSPLTEASRYGRGTKLRFNQDNLEVGGFFLRPRFFPELQSEYGTYTQYHLKNKQYIRVNLMQKNFGETQPIATLLSSNASFKLKEHTSIEVDVSKAWQKEKEGYGMYLQVFSEPIKKWRLGTTLLYASQDYPGYYKNTWQTSGYVNWDVNKKINLFFNFHQDENNAVRDTIIEVAPFMKRFNTGVQVHFNKYNRLRVMVQQAELKDRLAPAKFHYEEQALKFQFFHHQKIYQFMFGGEWGWKENFLIRGGLEQISRGFFEFQYRFFQRHQLKAIFQYYNQNNPITNTRQQFIYGLSLNSMLSPKTNLRFKVQNNHLLEEYYRDRNLMELDLKHRLNQHHEFQLRGRYAIQRRTIGQKDFSISAYYTWYFGIPLEKKKTLPNLKGVISNLGVETIEGIVLQLNGKTAVTDAQGQFMFKSIPPGNYYLLIDKETIGLHDIADIPSPILISIKKDTINEIRFGMTTSAEISGKIDLKQAAALSVIDKEDITLAPVMIELDNGEDVFRQLTDENGSFMFKNLRPGKWKLQLISNQQHTRVSFMKQVYQFELAASQKEKIRIEAQVKQRKIRFQKSFKE